MVDSALSILTRSRYVLELMVTMLSAQELKRTGGKSQRFEREMTMRKAKK